MAKPYDPKDFYYRKAKKQGLRARSAFKIEEILRRHRLLSHGDAVLDLGAAPGGFLQVLAEAVGPKGVAVGVDLEQIRNLGKAWVRTGVVDLLAPDALERIRALHPGPYRLVTSDMAPKTIGIKVTDEARSLELVRMALQIAGSTLREGGAFVAKVFVGGDFPALKQELRERFEAIHIVRPEATRESSYELYVVGTGFRAARPAARPAAAPAQPQPPAPAPAPAPTPTPTPTPVEPGPEATPRAKSGPATRKKAKTRKAGARGSPSPARPARRPGKRA